MQNVLTLRTEVDDQDYELEFTVTFGKHSIDAIKLDTVHAIELFAEDDVKYIPRPVSTLGEAISAKLIDDAWSFAKKVHLEEPEREYFTEYDQERY